VFFVRGQVGGLGYDTGVMTIPRTMDTGRITGAGIVSNLNMDSRKRFNTAEEFAFLS
jgi:hypothetical protein